MVGILIIITLILIFIFDIKTLIIPNSLNLILLFLGILKRGMDFLEIEIGIIGMGIYILPLVLIYGYVSDLYKKEVLGFGDIKLMLGLGYILGYTNFYDVYIFYMIAFILASVIGIIFILKKEKNRELAFTPFLIIAFIIMELRSFLWRKKALY